METLSKFTTLIVHFMLTIYKSENPDDNAELYININEKGHWIEIREKDEGYRKPVLKALTK